MEVKKLAVIGITALGVLTSCNDDLVSYGQGDMKIQVIKGDEWLHDFPLFLGIKQKNPPQIAIWVEDMEGNYITSIYASHKVATNSWQSNGGNKRKEALPVWNYARRVQAVDGVSGATPQASVDGISGATPRGSFDVKVSPVDNLKQFVIKVELNHSTDWNDNYPKNAKEGDTNYSGGKEGSGQPAVVYAVEIDLNSSRKKYSATIVGHSSPDGSNGNIYPDTSSLTSALNIAKEITINIL